MPAFDDSVFFASITELGQKLRAREFSCRELTEAFCTRMEKTGPRYNALALSLREQAIRDAKDVDDEIKRGRLRGPLQGIPYGAKDLLAAKGGPTTWGAKPFAGQVFTENAVVIEKLRKAKAVLFAKLSMVELAGGGGYRYAAASLQGPGLNPWDRTRWSGGSSSGSGSTVAAGLVPFALGSETSGSILTPAAYCGLTALRPTYGLVSRRGAMALAWTMDKIGPMCRSAEDCALVLEVIAGGDKEDPGSAGKSFHYAQQFVRKFEDLKIGYAPEDFEGWAAPETRPALGEALNLFRGLGAKMVEVRLPDLPYGAVTGTVISAEGAAIFQDLIESGEVDQLADQKQIAGLKASLDITAVDYLKAMRIRRLIQEALRNILSEVDILLTPARLGIASKVSDPLDRGGSNSSGPAPASNGMRDHIPAGNLAGLPALCLPCGFAEGMPVAVSLMGRPFSENTLIAFGKAYQAQTDWHKRRPKV